MSAEVVVSGMISVSLMWFIPVSVLKIYLTFDGPEKESVVVMNLQAHV